MVFGLAADSARRRRVVVVAMGPTAARRGAEYLRGHFTARNSRVGAVHDRQIFSEPGAVAERTAAASQRRLPAAVGLRAGGGDRRIGRVGSGISEGGPIPGICALRVVGGFGRGKFAHAAAGDLPAARERQSRSSAL